MDTYLVVEVDEQDEGDDAVEQEPGPVVVVLGVGRVPPQVGDGDPLLGEVGGRGGRGGVRGRAVRDHGVGDQPAQGHVGSGKLE